MTDILNDPAFPRSGTRVHVEVYRSARSMGADPSYTRVEGSLLAAVSAGRNTVLLGIRASSAVNSTLPVHDDFALGGFQHLSGLRPRDIIGDQFAPGSVTFRRRMVPQAYGHPSHRTEGWQSVSRILRRGWQRLVEPEFREVGQSGGWCLTFRRDGNPFRATLSGVRALHPGRRYRASAFGKSLLV